MVRWDAELDTAATDDVFPVRPYAQTVRRSPKSRAVAHQSSSVDDDSRFAAVLDSQLATKFLEQMVGVVRFESTDAADDAGSAVAAAQTDDHLKETKRRNGGTDGVHHLAAPQRCSQFECSPISDQSKGQSFLLS